jgi:predicted DNA-binding transcriptional regulator AlpA
MQSNMPPDTLPILIDRKTAAKIAGMSESWLRHMDAINAGPPKLRLGQGPGRVRYDLERYMDWLQSHSEPSARVDSTASHVIV